MENTQKKNKSPNTNRQLILAAIQAHQKEIAKLESQLHFSCEELKKKYFDFYDKIADPLFKKLVKKCWDYQLALCHSIPKSIEEAMWACNDSYSNMPILGTRFWQYYYNNTHEMLYDPYILSKWKPEKGEFYYYPSITSSSKTGMGNWKGSIEEERLFKAGFIVKTKKKAAELQALIVSSVEKKRLSR